MEQRQELFSIGEITRAAGVTRRMILNYEERGLICPDIKKGDAGNRYYTIDTFTKIRNIRILQDLGLSLDEIRGYYDNSIDLLSMIRRLEKLRDQLNLNIEKLYERTSAVPRRSGNYGCQVSLSIGGLIAAIPSKRRQYCCVTRRWRLCVPMGRTLRAGCILSSIPSATRWRQPQIQLVAQLFRPPDH